MTVDRIVPCTCVKYKPASCVSTYYGMPILRVCAGEYKGKIVNYYEAVCPRCGDHLIGEQYKSPFLALRAWNEWKSQMWERRDLITGEKFKDYDSLPSLMDGDGWAWNEPQASINKELEEWDINCV